MRLLRSVLALAGLTAVGAFVPPAIKMDVKPGETRCLSDSVRAGEVTTFDYRAVPTGTDNEVGKVKVTIKDPDGRQHYADLTTQSQKYVIAKETGGGTCRVCFKNLDRKGTSRVELMETDVLSENGPEPDTPQHLRPVVSLLLHAKDISQSLKQQLSEGAESEVERIWHENVLRSRISKVAAFTILVLLSVSGWQLALLNKFFRSKKLI